MAISFFHPPTIIHLYSTPGEFEHPIISYYFPTKASLFEAVLVEFCDELLQAHIAWLSGIEHMPPFEALTIYLDCFLDYNFGRPEPLRIIMLNSVLSNSLDELPGYHHFNRRRKPLPSMKWKSSWRKEKMTGFKRPKSAVFPDAL